MRMTRYQWRQVAYATWQVLDAHGRVYAIKYLRSTVGCGLSAAYHAVNRLKDVNWANVRLEP